MLQLAQTVLFFVVHGHACSRHGEAYYWSVTATLMPVRPCSSPCTPPHRRYNLKRKVAGLPPVTREWFDARKAQLSSAQAVGAAMVVPAGHVRVWVDPLTRKTFRTEQTYQAHLRSNKFQELVRKSGQPAPPPIITIRKLADSEPQQGVALKRGCGRLKREGRGQGRVSTHSTQHSTQHTR